MTSLSDMKPNTRVRVAGIEGDVRLLTRLASVGLVPGCTMQVVRNDAHRPVLVFERDSMVAINRTEAQRIQVEEVA